MIGRLSDTVTGILSSGHSSRRAKLQSIDGAVKAHERAHLFSLGGYARGGISYDYIITADGHRYAVGGSVGVDLKPVPGDPHATIQKMRTIRAAALSPFNPSTADTDVAAETVRIELQARHELQRQNSPASRGDGEIITGIPEPDTAVVSGSILYSSALPETVIRSAKEIRGRILQSGDLSAKNMQLLARTYAMEMQARKKLEAGVQNSRHINIIV